MIHKALKLLRAYYNFKQKDFAPKLGIRQGHLSEIERGTKTPSLALIQMYSSVLGIPVSTIFLLQEAVETGTVVQTISGETLALLEWSRIVSKVHQANATPSNPNPDTHVES